MNEKEEFEYAEKLNLEEATEYIYKIAEGLRSRSLQLQGRGQTIVVVPEDTLKLEVKAEHKEGKGKLAVEISWKEKDTAAEEKLDVIIGAPRETGGETVRAAKAEAPADKPE